MSKFTEVACKKTSRLSEQAKELNVQYFGDGWCWGVGARAKSGLAYSWSKSGLLWCPLCRYKEIWSAQIVVGVFSSSRFTDRSLQ